MSESVIRKSALPLADNFKFNLALGLSVPIPTLPADVMRSLSAPAVSAGIFLSAFHADAGGSGCGFAIKNERTDASGLIFSAVNTAGSTGNPATETERLRITSAGKVGIGTISPSRHLVVNADSANTFIRIQSSDTGNAGLEFGDQSDSVQAAIYQNASDNSLRFNGYNNSERLRITSDGKVAIGFNAPAVHGLSLGYSSTSRGFEFDTGSGFGSSSTIRAYYRPGTSYNALGLTGSTILFGINDVEKVRITSTGALLLGATATSNAEQFRIHTSDSGKAIIKLTNSTTGTGTGDGFEFGMNGNEQIEFVNKENTDMFFATNNTERLRITSGGIVNIGTNNQASGHSSSKLRVGTASGSDQGIVVFGNADTTTPALIITNWDGSQTQNKSVIHFDNSGWGSFQIGCTAGADAFGIFDDGAEKLRIDSSGHVLPGTNNAYDLGSTAKGWRNVYMNDLQLSNVNGDTNDVDGTQGTWTIQEGSDDLFLINRLNGKKYKFNLIEVL